MSSTDDPRPVGDALRSVRRQLGAPPPALLDAVRGAWSELVGATLAERCQPLHVRNGVLRVGVEDPAWAAQLRYVTDTLVAALAEQVPNAAITQISVTVIRPGSDVDLDGLRTSDEWYDGGPEPPGKRA